MVLIIITSYPYKQEDMQTSLRAITQQYCGPHHLRIKVGSKLKCKNCEPKLQEILEEMTFSSWLGHGNF
jgi:hypothetical protein